MLHFKNYKKCIILKRKVKKRKLKSFNGNFFNRVMFTSMSNNAAQTCALTNGGISTLASF